MTRLIRHSDAESSWPYRGKGCVHRAIRDQSRVGFLSGVISCNSAEPPVGLSLQCSLTGETMMLGGGWGRGGRVNPHLALELQGKKRLVQGSNFITFEC